MRAPGVAVALCLAVAACSGKVAPAPAQQPPAPPTWQSGSRLKVLYDDGGDGALSYVGIFDTQTQSACALGTASDGAIRCLPTGNGASVEYLDAACTQVALVSSSPTCAPSGPYAVSFVSTACGPEEVLRVYSADTSSSLPVDTPFYQLADGQCTPSSAAGTTSIAAAREVEPTTFVAGTTKLVDAGGGLEVDVFTADDGAVLLHQLVDAKRNVPCTAEEHITLHDGIAGCLPLPLAYGIGETFADASCTQRVASVGDAATGACTAEAIIAYDTPTDCSSDGFALYEVGASVSTSATYSDDTGSCSVSGSTTDATEYAFGAPLAPSDLAAFGSASLGTGRLRAIYRASTSGALLETTSFEDSARGNAACVPTVTSDGQTRCIPTYDLLGIAGDDGLTFYADAGCTELVLDLGTRGPCATLPPFAARVTSDGCGTTTVTELRQVTGMSPIVDAFTNLGGSCSMRPHIDGEAYAAVSDPVDLSTFPVVTRIQE